MFKKLIKLFLENRLNHVNEQIENIVEEIAKEEDEVLQKGKVAQATFELGEDTLREVRKLKTRIAIYGAVFGEIKDI